MSSLLCQQNLVTVLQQTRAATFGPGTFHDVFMLLLDTFVLIGTFSNTSNTLHKLEHNIYSNTRENSEEILLDNETLSFTFVEIQ